MCFIRAPYGLLSRGVLRGALEYTKHVEHGWVEFVGPQGVGRLVKYLSGVSARFEW